MVHCLLNCHSRHQFYESIIYTNVTLVKYIKDTTCTQQGKKRTGHQPVSFLQRPTLFAETSDLIGLFVWSLGTLIL